MTVENVSGFTHLLKPAKWTAHYSGAGWCDEEESCLPFEVARRVENLLAALDAYKACREATPETFADSMSLCLGAQLAWDRVQKSVAELRGAA